MDVLPLDLYCVQASAVPMFRCFIAEGMSGGNGPLQLRIRAEDAVRVLTRDRGAPKRVYALFFMP